MPKNLLYQLSQDETCYSSILTFNAIPFEIKDCAFSLGIVAISSGLNGPYFSRSTPTISSNSLTNLTVTGFVLCFVEVISSNFDFPFTIPDIIMFFLSYTQTFFLHILLFEEQIDLL